MAKTWGMDGWTLQSPVTLSEALGVDKGTISAPTLSASIPVAQQQAKSAQNSNDSDSAVPTKGEAAKNAALGKEMAAKAGWTGTQWTDLNNIVMAESGWNTEATNDSSGAYGIPQALPGSKMASSGNNWKTSASTQIAWMLEYIRSRYGTPQRAWAFHEANGWY